jgi:hypothetical protein
VPVGESFAAGEDKLAAFPVDGGGTAFYARDPVLFKELGRAKAQCCRADFPQQIGLGQRRALVGNTGFVADEGDRALKSLLPQ